MACSAIRFTASLIWGCAMTVSGAAPQSIARPLLAGRGSPSTIPTRTGFAAPIPGKDGFGDRYPLVFLGTRSKQLLQGELSCVITEFDPS